MTEQNKYGKR